ncbi:MAG: hypothetical protein C4534_04145 [Gaiellales bacterium]|nr:MAG: hypothetical protein C4534_04145 [Gaiellales bacterium]
MGTSHRSGAARPNDRAAFFFLSAIMAAAAAIRLVRAVNNSLWYDELYTVWASRLSLGELMAEVPPSGHPPLYYLLGHFWFTPGAGELRLRSISLVAGLATVWLVYRLGRELYSRRTGLWAAALAALSPPLVRYASEGTDMALMIAAATASLYFLVLGVRRGRALWWGVFVAASVVAITSHHLALTFIVAEAVFYLLFDRGPRRRLRQWLISQSFLALLAAVWLLYIRGAQQQVDPIGHSWVSDIAAALGRAPLLMLTDSNHIPTGELWAPFLVLCVVAVGLILASARTRELLAARQSAALAACVLTAVLLNTVVVLATQPVYVADLSSRYYLVAAPELLLLLAAPIALLGRRIALMASVALLIVSGWLTYPVVTTRVWDYRAVVETVSENYREGDILMAFPAHHFVVAMANYSPEPVEVLGGWIVDEEAGEVMFPGPPGDKWEGYLEDEINDPLSGEELRRFLDRQLPGASRLWIIAGNGEERYFPRSDVVDEALGEEWENISSWEFEGPLVLKLFQRHPG